jgi:gliding motility-associated-like protein
MRHSLLILFFLFFMAGNSVGQSLGPAIINSAGNTSTQSGMIYEWSVGELALVETMANSDAIITHGLLQSLVLPTLVVPVTTPVIFPANILTANGDGKNDTWIIKDIEKYPDNEIMVFDRAGRVVYSVKNYQNDWRGTLSGSPLAEGTYYYIIKFTKASYAIPVKGFITILH